MEKKEFIELMTAVSKAFRTKIDSETMIVYYEFLKDIDKNILKEAFKNIVEKEKYFPAVAEIKKECDSLEHNKKYEILERMKADGYFKESEYGISEYEKACNWLESGVIPYWFQEDIKKYSLKEIPSNKLIGGN